MTIALKLVLNCDVLDLEEILWELILVMHFLKHANMQQMDEFFCIGLRYVCVKTTQGDLQMYITWPKKIGKCRQEWNKACVNSRKPPRKLNTLVKTR